MSKRKPSRPRPAASSGLIPTLIPGNSGPGPSNSGPDEPGDAAPDSASEPGVTTLQVNMLIGLIATGGLDEHLSAIQTAVGERYRQRQRAHSNQAAAQIDVGDRVKLGHDIRPLYLHGASGTVTGWAGQSVIVQLDEPVGRFTTGQIRCPPLGLHPLPE